MTKQAKTIMWSVIGAVAALTAVGIYVFRPGKKTTTPPLGAPGTTAPPAGGGATTKIVTATSSNINLRAGAAASAPSVTTVDKNTYLGTLISMVPDADGKKNASGSVYQWAYVQPDMTIGLTDPFYVRTDLVMIN
jgi:hypothetical protein